MGKEEVRKIEDAFKEVYRKERSLTAADAWQDGVMRAVRRSGMNSPGRAGDLERFGGLVWRLSTAATLFALLLMVFALISDQGAASMVTQWFFADPLGVDLMHSLGIV
jgi:hypothetical protein